MLGSAVSLTAQPTPHPPPEEHPEGADEPPKLGNELAPSAREAKVDMSLRASSWHSGHSTGVSSLARRMRSKVTLQASQRYS
jgi:hypothetical protein